MNHSVAPSLFITPDFSVPRLAGSFLITLSPDHPPNKFPYFSRKGPLEYPPKKFVVTSSGAPHCSTMDHHSTASEMGMMGALRTGNMVVDMMIAMMVPYIFKLLMDLANGHGIENLRAVIFFWSPYHTRDIEHKILQTSWGGTVNQDRDLRNNVLIKAVQLYLDAHKIAYRNANLQLMSTKQESSSIWADSDDEGENTPAGKLKRFKVARKPPKHRWSRISAEGQPLVELMVTEHENDKGEKAEKTVVTHLYKFRSTTAGASPPQP